MAFLALYASLTLAVQPIEVQGSDFVNSVTGDRLQIFGVAYESHDNQSHYGLTIRIGINQEALQASNQIPASIH